MTGFGATQLDMAGCPYGGQTLWHWALVDGSAGHRWIGAQGGGVMLAETGVGRTGAEGDAVEWMLAGSCGTGWGRWRTEPVWSAIRGRSGGVDGVRGGGVGPGQAACSAPV